MTLNHFLIFLAMAIAVAFLAGVDSGLDEKYTISFSERRSVYCRTPGHDDSVCHSPYRDLPGE